MKKISFLFIVAILPLMASAQTLIDGIYYYLYSGNTNHATVAPGNIKYTGDINILPAVTYKDVTYTVTTIADHAFEGCHDVTSVTIPNSVTSIGEWAFYCCDGLTSITIPSSVTDIWSDIYFCRKRKSKL